MSFLKQLLSPFIEFDEQQNVQPNPSAKLPSKGNAPKAAERVPVSKPAVPAPPTSGTPLPGGRASQHVQHPLIDDDSVGADINETPKYAPNGTLIRPFHAHEQYFEALIEKANKTNPFFAGNDYKEFIDSKVDIDDIVDESLRYQTAFNILKASGLTKDKLMKTGQEYLNIIGRDLNVFQSAHAERYKKQLGQKELELKKKAEQLQALLQQVNLLKKELNAVTQDIKLGADVLNTIRNSFVLAGERKQDEILRELEKIEKYF